jgi:hypothetical protein
VVIDPSGADWLWACEDTTPWYPQARILRRSGDLVGLLRGVLSERPAS